ncbi:transporter substrate-binding domain-containing protein [Aliamphritea ceti]|uniref:transporter substrate-binding domain-containing protein n=1 Tax=Aliamphritea ceti TaxID=1524258 RepID=UPI0021C36078|nr:transporter substrate-binding domain-containing protein [Aliamphritea ceti]
MKIITKILATTLMSALPFASVMAGEALDRVMDKKLLKVATDANWAPQSFLNDNNEMDGFDVNVAQEVAKRLGVQIEFVTPAWDIITAGRWSGRWDLSIGSMTPTTERAKVLTFPAVYYYTPASFVVHKDSDAQQVSDLNGKKVGVTTASVHERYLQKDLTIDAEGVPNFEYEVDTDFIKSYQSSNVVLDDLRLGNGSRLDGALTSVPTINEAMKNNYPIKPLGEPVFFEPLALAIDKGDQEFNDKLAAIVSEMRADGTLSELSQKWYSYDYTSTK